MKKSVGKYSKFSLKGNVLSHTDSFVSIGARAQAEETLTFVRVYAPAEDSWTLACALNAFGSVVLSQGDSTQAQQLHERAIALFNEAGDLWLYGELHLFLANVYWAQGDEAQAQTFFQEGLAIHDQLGNAWVTGWFVSLFGKIALRQGDIPRARFLLEAGLKRHQQLGDQQGQALIYALLAQAAASEHDYLNDPNPGSSEPGDRTQGSGQSIADPVPGRVGGCCRRSGRARMGSATVGSGRTLPRSQSCAAPTGRTSRSRTPHQASATSPR